MDAMTKYHWQGLSALDSPPDETTSDVRIARAVRLVGSQDDTSDEPLSAPGPSHQDWSELIDRVRHTANHARGVEAQAQEQELRVQEVLERVREDVQNAAKRVRAAEARAVDIQNRFDALLRAADERASAAEERARLAEGWLARVSDTIMSEFDVGPNAKRLG